MSQQGGKLSKSGTSEPLVDQEVAHLAELRAAAQGGSDEMGAAPGTRRIALRYLVPVVIIALLAITIPLALTLMDRKGRPSYVKRDSESQARERGAEIDEAAVSSLTAGQVAKAFLAATTAEERLALVRNPEGARAVLSSFVDEAKAFPIAYSQMRRMGVASANGDMRFERYAVTMDDGSRRLICVAETPQGPLVDYQAFARFGTASWEELLAGSPGEEVRAVAQPSYYFSHEFADDQKWTAFRLSNPDWPDALTGYALVGSATAGVLKEILSKLPKQRVTLKLRAEGKSHEDKQVVIEKVLASGWLRTGGDLEDKWQSQKARAGGAPLR